MVELLMFRVRLIGRKHEIKTRSGCRGCDLGYRMPSRLYRGVTRHCLAGYTSESMAGDWPLRLWQ